MFVSIKLVKRAGLGVYAIARITVVSDIEIHSSLAYVVFPAASTLAYSVELFVGADPSRV